VGRGGCCNVIDLRLPFFLHIFYFIKISYIFEIVLSIFIFLKFVRCAGASLSNERGMLEAKLETLSQENKTLRTNLENEVDTVKIKTKLVLDLTETVSSLRQKLSLLERQLQDQGGELKTIEVIGP